MSVVSDELSPPFSLRDRGHQGVIWLWCALQSGTWKHTDFGGEALWLYWMDCRTRVTAGSIVARSGSVWGDRSPVSEGLR